MSAENQTPHAGTPAPDDQKPTAETCDLRSLGASHGWALSFDSLDAAVRLLALAEDDRQDDWTREVCRQSGEMLNELTRLVTTDHESKAAFIARVRATLKLPNR